MRVDARRLATPSGAALGLIRSLLGVVVAFGVTVPLVAHDFWIEPTTFAPEVGKVIGVRARVGDGFLGDPVPRDPALLDQLIVEDGSGRRPLVGHDGDDPAGLLRVTAPGLHVIGYLGKPSRVELSADKFNTYLKEEGLDAVVAARASMNHGGSAARELFTRCAKTLVLVGAATPRQHDRVLGCPFELVAERNPYVMEPGQALPLRVAYEGRPIKGALVVAMNRKRASEKIKARSDENGRVRLTLPSGGAWLIKAVHMVPAPVSANADWASFWASVTFDLPAGSVAPEQTRP
jgi:hypothetical protein